MMFISKIYCNYTQIFIVITVDVTVVTTAFHKGYYQFRLCQNDVPQKGKDASIAVTQDCFEKNILKSPKNDTKYVYAAQNFVCWLK